MCYRDFSDVQWNVFSFLQGLNFISGILLLVVKNEEKVFWLMDTLVNDILPGMYTCSLISEQV